MAGVNWEVQFRAAGEPAWRASGGDVLAAALTQAFAPWPQGGVEAQVRYVNAQEQAVSDWSETKQVA